MQQVRVEGLVRTKVDIVGEQVKGVALATNLEDVSSVTSYNYYVVMTLWSILSVALCVLYCSENRYALKYVRLRRLIRDFCGYL